MHSDRFRWEAGTRLFDQGREVAADEAGALGALRQAIRAGGEFLVGPGGVERLEQGAPGFLRTRSSGTTGTAKTIRRSHRSWIASFEVSRDHLGIGAALFRLEPPLLELAHLTFGGFEPLRLHV